MSVTDNEHWRPHDGSEQCPCPPVHVPVAVRFRDGTTRRFSNGLDIVSWASVEAWRYAEPADRRKYAELAKDGWHANSGHPPPTSSPMARVSIRRRNKQTATDLYAWFSWDIRNDPYDIVLYKFEPITKD